MFIYLLIDQINTPSYYIITIIITIIVTIITTYNNHVQKDKRTAKIIPNTHNLSHNSSNPAVKYELNIDAMSHTHSVPKITNRHYNIYGNQTHIMGYIKKPNQK